MNGLIILYNPSLSLEVVRAAGSRPKGGCFAHLFAPILEHVGKLYWITLNCASAPFQNAMAGIEAFDRVAALSIGVEGLPSGLDIQLWKPPTLADLAEYVRDDYQDFLGIKRDRDPLEATRRFAEIDNRNSMLSPGWTFATAAAFENEWRMEFAAAIEEETEMAFFTHESSDITGIWEMYAADSHLLDTAQDRCRELGGGVHSVQRVDFGERNRVLSELWATSIPSLVAPVDGS